MTVKGKILAIKDRILVKDMEFGEEVTQSGIVIQNLNGKLEGIKPRWGQVWAIGPEVTDIDIGEWVYVAHGRWTRGIKVEDHDGSEIVIRRIDNDEILLVSKEKPSDVTVGKGL